MRAVRVRVTGRVQGVSFRGYAAQEAVRLELVGWVRNEADGTVLGHFEGPDEDVAEMVEWLRSGSPAAEVDGVDVTDAEPSGAESFEVDY